MGTRGRRLWDRSRIRRGARRGWIAVCGVGLAIAVVVVVTYPSEVRVHELAVALDDRGTSAVATEVTVFTEHGGRAGIFVSAVRVAFPLRQGGEVHTALRGITLEDASAKRGWGPPPAGSAYSAPLEVVYLPEDPQRAMSPPDIEAYRFNALPDARITATVMVVPAAVTAFVWCLRRPLRRRGPAPEPTRGRHDRRG